MLRLIRMVQAGRALVFGDGGQLRSMTFVDDLVDAVLLSLVSEAAAGGTFWIADPRPYTTVTVLESIAHVLGVPLQTIRLPVAAARIAEGVDHALGALGAYQMDVHVLGEAARDVGCDPSRAMRVLGFAPAATRGGGLEAGLRAAIEWSRAHGEL
jgi:nucleoside-diphosphate-sugar epimerase